MPPPPIQPTNPSVGDLPTAFSAETCLRRGLCPVSTLRPQGPLHADIEEPGAQGTINQMLESHSLYYEQHAPPGVTEATAKYKVVFIMGLNSSSFAWGPQVRHFTQPNVGLDDPATILVFDNRGVGNSDYPRGPYTTSGMAEDAICLLDTLGWTADRELHVVGISLGGMIAQELAYKIPHRVASLFLAVTTPGGRVWQNFPPNSGLRSLAKLTFTGDPVKKVPMILDMLYPTEWLDSPAKGDPAGRTNRQVQGEAYLERVAVTRPQQFLGHVSQMASGLTHHFQPERLAVLAEKIPKITVVTGDDDHLVNPRNSKRLMEGFESGGKEKAKNVELVEWEGTGHGLNHQRAEWFNALLERTWMEGSQNAAAREAA